MSQTAQQPYRRPYRPSIGRLQTMLWVGWIAVGVNAAWMVLR